MALHVVRGNMELIVAALAVGLLAITPIVAIILIRDAILEMRAA